jgi:hypothetical protein
MSSATKARVVRKRAKRNEAVPNCAIALACDRFFRSRGIPTAQRENFNKSNTTENQEPNPWSRSKSWDRKTSGSGSNTAAVPGETERGCITSWTDKYVRVVYRSDNQWRRFQDFTGCATNPCATNPSDLTFLLNQVEKDRLETRDR